MYRRRGWESRHPDHLISFPLEHLRGDHPLKKKGRHLKAAPTLLDVRETESPTVERCQPITSPPRLNSTVSSPEPPPNPRGNASPDSRMRSNRTNDSGAGRESEFPTMTHLLATSGFDSRAKYFRSVGISAIEVASQRLKLAIVTAANIARGLPPVRYIRTPGKLGRSIFISSGLQQGNVLSEFLIWREIARCLDDYPFPDSEADSSGRWSRHIPDDEIQSVNTCVGHVCCPTKIRVNHTLQAKGFGQMEFDESRSVPRSLHEVVKRGIDSPQERWTSGFADALACPSSCSSSSPKLFRLVQYSLRIDLGLEFRSSECFPVPRTN